MSLSNRKQNTFEKKTREVRMNIITVMNITRITTPSGITAIKNIIFILKTIIKYSACV